MENQLPKQSIVYSRHILFFPFQWRPIQPTKNPKTALNQALTAVGVTENWKPEVYDRQKDYSSYNYLHDFVHPAVFQQSGSGLSQVYNFQYLQDLPVELHVLKSAINEKKHGSPSPINTEDVDIFKLKFFKARLNIYETGVGILILYLDNFEHHTPESVLIINDLIRRLYPSHLNFNNGALGPKVSGLLPQCVKIGNWSEDWSAYPHDKSKDNIPARFLPAYITGLLGPQFHYDDSGKPETGVFIHPVLDDRMFLVSMIDDASLTKKICTIKNDKGSPDIQQDKTDENGYLKNDFWYSFVFADKGEPQIAHTQMQEALIGAATYPRWANNGTLYGASRYSFVATLGLSSLKTPMTNNYLLLVELCLAQRATALRYREEASSIAARLSQTEGNEGLAKEIRQLHGDYIRFINRFNFIEATPVEQGIELYDLIRRQMRVQEQVEGLRSELEELHNYATLLNEEKRSQAINFLTVLGAAFLLPSFLLSYFAFSEEWHKELDKIPVLMATVFVMGGALAGWLYYSAWLQKPGWKRTIGILIILLYLLLLASLPHLGEWGII